MGGPGGDVLYRVFKGESATASIGKVSDEPLSLATSSASVTGTSAELVAANASDVTREVLIFVPSDADTGIHIADDGDAATTSDFLIPPGGTVSITTLEAINAIRAGSTNVTVYLILGTV